MRQFSFKIAAMLALLISAGCSPTTSADPETSSAGDMIPGTYLGTGEGRNGAIVVEVTVSENAIEAVNVISERETQNTGTVPVETYPELIVANQTINLDNISGATISSVAMKNAVKNAILSAKGNVDDFNGEVDSAVKAEDCSADIVVIGAGGAGMRAAITAASEGKSVILLEKLGIAGGTSNYSIESFGSVGDAAHKSLGSDMTADILADNLTQSNPSGNPEAFKILAEQNGEAADWLRSIGAELTVAGGQVSVTTSREVGELGTVIVSALKAECGKTGVDLRLNSKGTEILMTDGAVSGVKVSNPAGEYTINTKAVIIATGGFGANSAMVAEYMPSLKGYNHSCSVGNTGDGQQMASAMGAELKDMDYIRVNFTYTTAENQYYYYMGSLFNTGAIFVNDEGKRFVNDQGAYGVGMQVVEQGGNGWAIFDNSIVAGVADVRNYEKLGLFVSADSIEELAKKTGIPTENLKATIETYRSYVANGKDEEFGRAMLNMTFDEAPYYASRMTARVQGTFGGISTNLNTEVLNGEGEILPGLFAAGEVASEGTWGANPAAVNLVFGKIAGLNAAAYVSAH